MPLRIPLHTATSTRHRILPPFTVSLPTKLEAATMLRAGSGALQDTNMRPVVIETAQSTRNSSVSCFIDNDPNLNSSAPALSTIMLSAPTLTHRSRLLQQKVQRCLSRTDRQNWGHRRSPLPWWKRRHRPGMSQNVLMNTVPEVVLPRWPARNMERCMHLRRLPAVQEAADTVTRNIEQRVTTTVACSLRNLGAAVDTASDPRIDMSGPRLSLDIETAVGMFYSCRYGQRRDAAHSTNEPPRDMLESPVSVPEKMSQSQLLSARALHNDVVCADIDPPIRECSDK
ncbi:hypothetical protein BDZ89DRAFT_1148826 [Hymenopellis radicata]|nr:hypothetical protein BDZ89DRAFT_1148826 [Hymenopellis radicata]